MLHGCRCCHLPILWCLQQISFVIYCRDACEHYTHIHIAVLCSGSSIWPSNRTVHSSPIRSIDIYVNDLRFDYYSRTLSQSHSHSRSLAYTLVSTSTGGFACILTNRSLFLCLHLFATYKRSDTTLASYKNHHNQ